MNIVHLLSPTGITGSEAYCLELSEEQIKLGHNVSILADSLNLRPFPNFEVFSFSNRHYPNRAKLIKRLRKFLINNNIDVVHCHSRACSWIAVLATKWLKIPVISTVHGRQHIHFSSTNYNFYGDKIIAVCNNIKIHLERELNIQNTSIQVLPNTFDFSKYENIGRSTNDKLVLSIIGRTNSIKGEMTSSIIKNLADELLSRNPNLIIRIIGGKIDNLGKDILNFINLLNEKHNNRIETIGFVYNLNDYIMESSLIIAAGRTAVESLYLEKKVLGLGESAYCGLITESNISAAVESNFGDIADIKENIKAIDYDTILKDINENLNNTKLDDSEMIMRYLKSIYSLDVISNEIIEIYQAERMKKYHNKYIPVLMYHQLVSAPIESKHKIFVTKNKFEKHLDYIKHLGLTTITFEEYFKYKIGILDIKDFPKKPIVLTFDDGYSDTFDIISELSQKRQFKTVHFLIGDENLKYNKWDVDKGEVTFNLMNDSQIRKLIQLGHEIGSHTLSHPDLVTQDIATIKNELEDSKKQLEIKYSKPILSFCYPYGSRNEITENIAKKAEYKFAVATDSGGLHWEDNIFRIFRIQIFEHHGFLTFLKKTSAWYRKRYYKKRGK